MTDHGAKHRCGDVGVHFGRAWKEEALDPGLTHLPYISATRVLSATSFFDAELDGSATTMG
jgi:hypothetical protein